MSVSRSRQVDSGGWLPTIPPGKAVPPTAGSGTLFAHHRSFPNHQSGAMASSWAPWPHYLPAPGSAARVPLEEAHDG